MLPDRMKFLLSVAMLLSAMPLRAGSEEAARQVLAAKCGGCHGAAAMGGLRLDSAAGFAKGGKSGKPALEKLLPAVMSGAMPPGGRLKTEEIDALEKWIGEGAPWGRDGHWAWQPIGAVRAGDSIDSLIDRRLREQGIAANPRADKRTVIRRMFFDLVGLPPTEGEYALAFRDRAEGWEGRLADRLLGSAHFGENWGRHWLDVARYGEDDFSGTAMQPYKNAWRYRDWAIGAVNANMPYDRFLKAQLAGDLMGDAGLVGGLGLTGLGPWYYGISQPPQARADERHDRVDVVSRGMLGVTVACARCHDHKYDPFSQKDYYALAGVFASSKYQEYPLVSETEVARWKAKKAEVDAASKLVDQYLERQGELLKDRFAREMARYMLGTGEGLDAEVLKRWKEYLAKPEEFHPFLKAWFADRSEGHARAFQELMIGVLAEKRQLDADNRVVVEAAMKAAPKPVRTIVLPGGYRSDEDFNPGADVPSKSLERDRYVAYNRTFQEASAPLKFSAELTVKLLPQEARGEYLRLKGELDRLKTELPAQYGYVDGIAEFEAWDLPLNVRGNPEDLGEVVPRHFPTVLGGEELRRGSGRLQLAETVGRHPLAARVAVNRIWMHLFGEGIVRTPSNFGLAGDRPGNAELLEYLAARFIAIGYDVKAMTREIVLSEAYRRTADKGDQENRLWWRQNRKRLAAEPLRDSLLAVSGRLDRSVGGASGELKPEFVRRTVYAKVGRFQAEETLSLFDLPSAAVTCEQRVVTNVPLQKLFFLNSEMVAREAAALGVLLKKKGLERGYQLVFQRGPSVSEKKAAREFLKRGGSWVQLAQVLMSSNEFAYVD